MVEGGKNIGRDTSGDIPSERKDTSVLGLQHDKIPPLKSVPNKEVGVPKRVDARDRLRAQGVPEALLSGLNERGVFIDYVDSVRGVVDGGHDKGVESSTLGESLKRVDHYYTYVDKRVRSTFEAQGLTGNQLEDAVYEASDKLLGDDVPVDEIEDAVGPLADLAAEDSKNPIDIIRTIRTSDAKGKLDAIFGEQLAEPSTESTDEPPTDHRASSAEIRQPQVGQRVHDVFRSFGRRRGTS